MNSWPKVKLGEVLRRVKDAVIVQDDQIYARLTIRMNGNGIVQRDRLLGHEIGTKKQFVAHAGQLVLSKIDARNGAFGILPPECDNAIITGNFWAFDADHKRLLPQFFDYLTKTPMFVEFCIRASEGTTNRLYLQEHQFLSQEIMLPPLAEQRRMVTRIEELAAQIQEARTLRQQAIEEAESLVAAETNILFSNKNMLRWTTRPLGSIADIRAGVTLGRQTIGETIKLPYLRVANVQDGHLDLSEIKEIEIFKTEIDKWRLHIGDLLLTEGGDWDKLGRGTVWNGEIPICIHQNHIFRIRVQADQFLPEYLSRQIASSRGKAYFQSASKQTTNLASINQRQLKAFEIISPSLSEQRRIVGELNTLQSQMETLKRHQVEAAAELDALLPAILDRAFSGQLMPQESVSVSVKQRPIVDASRYFIQLIPALLREINRPITLKPLNATVALLFLPNQLIPLVETAVGKQAADHFKTFSQPNEDGAFKAALNLLIKTGTVVSSHSNTGDSAILRLGSSRLPPITVAEIAMDARYLAAIIDLIPVSESAPATEARTHKRTLKAQPHASPV